MDMATSDLYRRLNFGSVGSRLREVEVAGRSPGRRPALPADMFDQLNQDDSTSTADGHASRWPMARALTRLVVLVLRCLLVPPQLIGAIARCAR